jgi:hypothetical protein
VATLAIAFLWVIQASLAAADDPFLPRCRRADEYRTPVAIWQVDATADGRLSSAPPRRDGKLVYIRLGADNDYADCINAPDDNIYTFAFSKDKNRPDSGDLKVHIRGKVQFADFGDICYFSGFYIEEPASSGDEGGTETSFRPADKFEVMSSGHYCLENPASGPRPVRRSALPPCKRGDEFRMPVPIWKPALTPGDDVLSRPPEGDGRIVFISIVPRTQQCRENDGQLFTFGFPWDPKKPTYSGGLSVNLRGNAHSVKGRCALSGFYMNEPVFGIHQGWVETFFGAVDKDKLIASGTYCLAQTGARHRHHGKSR